MFLIFQILFVFCDVLQVWKFMPLRSDSSLLRGSFSFNGIDTQEVKRNKAKVTIMDQDEYVKWTYRVTDINYQQHALEVEKDRPPYL